VHDDPGRLVDDEQVPVLVRNPQLARLRLQRRFLPVPWLDLERLSPFEPATLLSPLAVDQHRSNGEEALGLRARADLGERGDEPVEPFAGRLRWNREL
jgi:hypothetical protein